MAEKVGEAYVDIVARTEELERGLGEMKRKLEAQDKQSQAMFKRMQGGVLGVRSAYLKTAATVASITILMKKSIKATSDLEEVTSKFNVVFSGNMEVANKSAKELVENYAMSTREAREYLSSVQDLLVPMGMASDQAANMSGEIVKLSADLGSFNNMPTSQVMENIQAALTGEGQVMKKYGVIINETTILQEAMNSGLVKTKDELNAVKKAQAAYNIMVRQTKAAQGDMIRTSDSYANVMKKVNARIEDLLSDGGALAGVFRDLGQAFLDASKDGSPLLVALKGILQGVADTVRFFANIKKVAEWFTAGSAASERTLKAQEESTERIVELGKEVKKLNKEIIGLGYESIKQAEENSRNDAKANELLKERNQLIGLIRIQSNRNQGLIESNIKMTDEAGKAFGVQKHAVENLEKAEKDLEDAIKKRTEAHKKGKGAIDGLTEAQNKQVASINKLKAKYEMIANAIVGIFDLAGQAIQANFDAQLQRLEQHQERYTQFLEYMKEMQLAAAGFAEESEEEKNKKDIATLEKRLKSETDARKKDAIKKQLDEKKNLQKKYEIEQKFELAQMIFEEQMEARRRALRRQAAIAEKAMNAFRILAQTPVAVMAAFTAGMTTFLNPIAAAILAGVAGAFGAAQFAVALATPLPAAAKGLVTDQPYIGGEAGTEMALPLEYPYVKNSIDVLTRGIVDQIAARTKETPELATVAEEEETGAGFSPAGGDIILDGEKVGIWIWKGTKNATIKIAQRAVVKG